MNIKMSPLSADKGVTHSVWQTGAEPSANIRLVLSTRRAEAALYSSHYILNVTFTVDPKGCESDRPGSGNMRFW